MTSSPLQLQVNCIPEHSLVLEHIGRPIIQSLRLSNNGSLTLRGLELGIQILSEPEDILRIALPSLPGGESQDLSYAPLKLGNERLQNIVEDEKITLLFKVYHQGMVITQELVELILLAYNAMSWSEWPRETYACFVTPNHPVIAQILKQTSEVLKRNRLDGSLEGYQSGNPERVREMVEALYETFADFKISYIDPPAGEWSRGQRIRLPDQVFYDKLGTCADLTPLAASCLEQMGLYPIIVFIPGHVYPGVFINSKYAIEIENNIIYEVNTIYELVEAKELLLFDSSSYASVDRNQRQLSFAKAEEKAKECLQTFDCVINLYQARRAGYIPLPIRMKVVPDSTEEVVSIAQRILLEAARNAKINNPDPPIFEKEDISKPLAGVVAGRIKRWKEKLLDLSNSNRLLHLSNVMGTLKNREDFLNSESLELKKQIKGKIFQSFGKGKSSFLTLSIPSELLGDLEDQLESGRRLELLPGQEGLDNAAAIAFAMDELRQGYCRTKLVLGAPDSLPRDWLIKAARALAKEARLMEEEQGASPLYLALGLLQWRDTAGMPRLAPLVLYPVELKIDTQKQQVYLHRSKGDPVGNITLVEKLHRDFEIDLGILSVLPEDSHGVDLNAVLKTVREVAAFQPGWRVFSEAVITNFNFGKFVLWKDLQDNTDKLLNNALVNHIANAGRNPLPDPLQNFKLSDLDQESYKDLPLVVDCDSSQLGAIYAALKGRSFVLQGPPGTGKSQTITNLIASCIAANKSVLFVAEKQAAVEVVHRRLKSVGLSVFCLDLHSQNNDRLEVLSSLEAALRQEREDEINWKEFCQELESLRTELRRYTQALHQKRPIGFSIFDMLSQQELLKNRSLSLPDTIQVNQLTVDELKSQVKDIKKFTESIQNLKIDEQNTWDFLNELQWQTTINQTLNDNLWSISQSLENLQNLASSIQAISVLANQPWPIWQDLAMIAEQAPLDKLPTEIHDPLRWPLLVQKVKDWLSHFSQLNQETKNRQEQWKPNILEQNLDDLIQQTRATASLVIPIRWIRGFFLRRQLQPYYKGKVPRLKDLVSQLRALRATQQLQYQVDSEKVTFQQCFPQWQGDKEELKTLVDRYHFIAGKLYALHKLGVSWEHLSQLQLEQWQTLKQNIEQITASCQQISQRLNLPSFPPEDRTNLDLSSFKDWADILQQQLPQLRDSSTYHDRKQEFLQSPLGPIWNWYESGLVSLPDLADTYRAVVLKVWFQDCFDSESVLCHFNRDSHQGTIERFQQLEREYLDLSQRYVRYQITQRFPRLGGLLPGSEMAELKREIAKKKSQLSIRSLFQRIPNLLPILKPCFLMSPISVAQYLPPDNTSFDLIIFDEASQIETHDAIGAIARGKQLIVVGDNKQMPPTKFFGRSDELSRSNSEDDVEDLESILDEVKACCLPEQMLQWHYRSRHESLILFSNQRYYDGRLNLFPAATRSHADLGLQWHPVSKGYYQPGERVNRREAEALVDYLVQQFNRYRPNERSFGVITFSTPQQFLIEQLLDEARQKNPKLEPWFDKDYLEYCFVKNLETVQGDERDEILFSICYAPQKNGRLSMNFGPLNREGGERRLNVAITRARTALHIFSTLTADQINLNRTNAVAVRHLKDFLALVASFSNTGHQDSIHPESFDSDFHRQVYDCLRQAGYQVECQVGCADYRIDFAILYPDDPSRYALGIECDGYNYCSAATVRDRDHSRQSVLEHMGWKLCRVWSVDWYLNRESAEQYLLNQVAQALTVSPPIIAPIAPPSPPIIAPILPSPREIDKVDPPRILGLPYKKAILGEQIVGDTKDFYSESVDSAIDEYLLQLIDCEAPIVMGEAAQRISQCWNFRRFTQRAYDRVKARVQVLANQSQLYLEPEEDVIWKSFSQKQEWRGFRNPPPGGRTLEQIPKIEIQAAMLLITQEALSITDEDLLRESLRQLTEGIRLTANQRSLLQTHLDDLLVSGKIQHIRDRYSVP